MKCFLRLLRAMRCRGKCRNLTTMNTTESSRFSRFMQEHGLYRAGLGIEGLAEMRKLQAEPEPLRARIRGGSAATSTLKFLGQMIRHGFAELRKDEGLYYLLPAGAEWLRQVDAVLNVQDETREP